MITAGIDCGAKNTKTIIMNDGEIVAKSMVFTGFDQKEAVDRSLFQALEAAGLSENDLEKIGGTGSGRESIHVADVMVNDFKAMAERIYSLIERVNVEPEFAITGGTAKNRGVMDRLMPMIGLRRMTTKWDSQIAGALGASLFGYDLCRQGESKREEER